MIKNNKKCFVTCYFGSKDKIDINGEFKINKNFDYYLFTNLLNSDFKKTSWNIITINYKKFKDEFNNNVKISRYFKFLLYKYFENEMNLYYEIIFYCDCYFYPLCEIDWEKLCNKLRNSEFGIMQYEHNKNFTINDEINFQIKRKKDKEENLNNHRNYLNLINKNINLKNNYGNLYENALIGFNVKSIKVRNFIEDFWIYYNNINNKTYRDQILWNFLYIHNNLKPIVENKLSSYFLGNKKVNRNIKDYNFIE